MGMFHYRMDIYFLSHCCERVGKVSLTLDEEGHVREGMQNLGLWIYIIVYVKPDYEDVERQSPDP